MRASVWGAACCGGGSSSANLLTTDDRLQWSIQSTFSEVTVDYVDTQGQWFAADERVQVVTHKIENAFLLSDLWQAGVSLPLIQKKKAGESASGLGDVALNLGYEYLPDWDYSFWRPRGLAYIQLVAPTGVSSEESTSPYKLDTRGRGFWKLGVGTNLSKGRGPWDGSLSAEVHYAFEKPVQSSEFQGVLKPGWGGLAAVGLGYNFLDWRVGAGLAWVYEDPLRREGTSIQEALLKKLATGSVSLGYLFPEHEGKKWGITLSYADQTLFGDPFNTSLEQQWVLALQHRWMR